MKWEVEVLHELKNKFLQEVVSESEPTTDEKGQFAYSHTQAAKVLEDFVSFAESNGIGVSQ